jgi:hypothetical protein
VVFQAELVLQRPDDRLHPLAQPVGEDPRVVFVPAGWAHQGKLKAGEEPLGSLASQALVGDHGRTCGGPVGRLVDQQLPDGLAFAHQLG